MRGRRRSPGRRDRRVRGRVDNHSADTGLPRHVEVNILGGSEARTISRLRERKYHIYRRVKLTANVLFRSRRWSREQKSVGSPVYGYIQGGIPGTLPGKIN